MTQLILGADRASIRMIIDRGGQVIDETLSASAIDRNELVLIEALFATHSIEWVNIDRLGVLILPHSHTSVRITTTLLSIAGWLYDRSIVHIMVPELGAQTAPALLKQLTQADRAA